MDETHLTEAQQELFPDLSEKTQKSPGKIRAFARPPKTYLVPLTTEQLILGGVVAILIFCLVFFLGVIRGKAIARGGDVRRLAVAAVKPLSVTPGVAQRTPVVASGSSGSAEASAARIRQVPGMPVISGAVRSTGDKVSAVKNGEKPYTIQLIAQRKKDLALAEIQSIRKYRSDCFLIPTTGFYQVCVGRYANQEEAKKDLSFFKQKYGDCYLRRIH